MMKNMISAGAYYNPSCITLSTIGLSVMVTVGCKAEKTIEMMESTVEERRLIGSGEIRPKPRINRKHVIVMLNSDMVGYKIYDGIDISKSKDEMSIQKQSSLLVELMIRYLNSLEHRHSARPYAGVYYIIVKGFGVFLGVTLVVIYQCVE